MTPPNRDHQRPKSNPAALLAASDELGVPHEIGEQVTGVLQGEELSRARAEREDADRIARLEIKDDAHTAAIADLRVDFSKQMGEVRGALGTLAGEVRGLATVVTTGAARDQLMYKASVEVGTAKELDKFDKKKNQRERWTKIVGGAVGGGTILEILHRMFG